MTDGGHGFYFLSQDEPLWNGYPAIVRESNSYVRKHYIFSRIALIRSQESAVAFLLSADPWGSSPCRI